MLTSTERGRYEDANKAFLAAFVEAYEDGKAKLASGELARDVDDSVLTLEVSRHEVMDGAWQGHVYRFVELGGRAARAKRRRGEAQLKLVQGEESTDARFAGFYTWAVNLNPGE